MDSVPVTQEISAKHPMIHVFVAEHAERAVDVESPVIQVLLWRHLKPMVTEEKVDGPELVSVPAAVEKIAENRVFSRPVDIDKIDQC